MSFARATALAFLALAALACGDDTEPCGDACAQAETVVDMDFTGASGFFGSPFPSDARRVEDGRPDISGFPNPGNIVLVDRVLDVLRQGAHGFGVSSGIFFRTTAPLDASSLPSLAATTQPGAAVALIGVDDAAPDRLVQYPVTVRFTEAAGSYSDAHLISLLPLQGVPLRPNTRYAAVVTRAVMDASGRPLGVAPGVEALLRGEAPEGMSEAALAAYADAIDVLGEAGIAREDIAALTVFTTDDPVSAMGAAIEAARANDPPSIEQPFVRTDEFPTYCVYETTLEMPVYQEGEAPYLEVGGGWIPGPDGAPILQKHETARVVVTVPKSAMPPDGYPLVVFSRTGGGGDRPLVDRGLRAEPGGSAVEPGTGPALELARAGFAGVSPDGPHGGLRNVSGSDEQFLVFNFQNPLALRDNVRQSALELALMPDVMEDVEIDVADCPGATAPDGLARFDTGTMAVMGHSMGASIAPLSLVHEPRLRAAVLSGAGGSFLANMMYKEKPLAVRPLAELILGMTITGESLTDENPFLSMLQWAGEPADNPVYGRHVVREPLTGGPRHVLMMQGIVDHYIMPPIANATSLSFGLDLAGPSLDVTSEELAELSPLESLLAFAGSKQVELPAASNTASNEGVSVTAVVAQYPEDGVEDGHEVVFQTTAPKHAYACFLEALASGAPFVPAAGAPGDPCSM